MVPGRSLAWAALLAALLCASGCGPVVYTAAILRAEGSVAQAENADAADLAPYELTFAQAHLTKAKEEAAEGHYQDASRFADRAHEHGQRAVELARRRARSDPR